MHEKKQNHLIEQIKDIIPHLKSVNAIQSTHIDGVRFCYSAELFPRCGVMYEPSLILIFSGHKRAFLPEKNFEYGAGDYLYFRTHMPFECEAETSPEDPFISLVLRLDYDVIIKVMEKMELQQGPSEKSGPDDLILNGKMSDKLAECAIRAFRVALDKEESSVLSDSCLQEIYYRLLQIEGPQNFLCGLKKDKNKVKVIRSVIWIHKNIAEKFSVLDLAKREGMSESSYFSAFKKATGETPLQYVKLLRLHKAKELMESGHKVPTQVALFVGYESYSQFSREFKRLLRVVPSKISPSV